VSSAPEGRANMQPTPVLPNEPAEALTQRVFSNRRVFTDLVLKGADARFEAIDARERSRGLRR